MAPALCLSEEFLLVLQNPAPVAHPETLGHMHIFLFLLESVSLSCSSSYWEVCLGSVLSLDVFPFCFLIGFCVAETDNPISRKPRGKLLLSLPCQGCGIHTVVAGLILSSSAWVGWGQNQGHAEPGCHPVLSRQLGCKAQPMRPCLRRREETLCRLQPRTRPGV